MASRLLSEHVTVTSQITSHLATKIVKNVFETYYYYLYTAIQSLYNFYILSYYVYL